MAPFKILMCDDEAEIVEELSEFFNEHGWEVRLCHNTVDAKRLLVEGPRPDLLLTDLRLDDRDGTSLIAFAQALPKEMRPQLHAIMTGYVIEDTTADDLGADVLYLKPVDPVALLNDIERRLAI